MQELSPGIWAGKCSEPFPGVRIDLRRMPDRQEDPAAQRARIEEYHRWAARLRRKGREVAFCCAQGRSRSMVVAALFLIRCGETPPPVSPSPGLDRIYTWLENVYRTRGPDIHLEDP